MKEIWIGDLNAPLNDCINKISEIKKNDGIVNNKIEQMIDIWINQNLTDKRLLLRGNNRLLLGYDFALIWLTIIKMFILSSGTKYQLLNINTDLQGKSSTKNELSFHEQHMNMDVFSIGVILFLSFLYVAYILRTKNLRSR